MLNLSSNKLQEIPEVPEWSPCLTVLDLSNNQLSSLPSKVIAPAIRSLDISRNKFHTVPLSVCSFVTLHSLDLSDNPNIVALPVQMGRLGYLSHLNLSGLKNLREPPKNLQKEGRECIRYLNSKLRNARGFYHMKLMLLGNTNRGKTTLLARLQGIEYIPVDESTVGVDISEWRYRPSVGRRAFHFSIWDFAGEKEYYAIHQCFLSQRSLYLLLFNLKHGDKGVEELRPWLNNIALRAPRSCVIIIGTHLDEIPDEERGETDTLLHRVGTLAASYNNKLQIMEVLPVGLKNRIENIGLLKEAIYNHAANYKNRGGQLIMGQKIPASYHALDKQLETVQQEVRQGIRDPVMYAKEFKTMVHQMNLSDIQDDEELKTATLFLTDVGSLLHFDDRGHNLHELYFVDPRWLCEMMSKLVTIKEKNPYVKCGILYSKDIPMLFKDKQFPWKHFEQFLTLLDRFEIALPLDNRRVLIPSMLPDERPKEFEDEEPDNHDLVYSRFIMFSSANTPPGFWSRLLSRIMHSVPKVCYALDMSSPASEQAPLPISYDDAEAEMSFNMYPMTTTAHNRAFKSSIEISLNVSTMSLSDAQSPGAQKSTASTLSDPQLLPNFPKSLPNNISDSFDPKDIHLEYWRTGLFYKDPHIMFRIESLLGSKQFKREKKDGVLVTVSANNTGKKIIGQFVNLVVSLVNEWYPGLQEGKYGSSGLQQKVPCFECIKTGRAKPFEFKVEQCLPIIGKYETTIECGYFRDDPAKNHTVSLGDIVPDLLFQDIDPEFILEAEEITYQEDDSSLLGIGGYGKVYRGKYKGKSVAIKKYLSRVERAFTELREEAMILQQLHHPCIVNFIGVCVHPLCALVLEEAPLRSLEFPLVKKKIPISRLTMFRIVAEIAAGLHYMHSRGIVKRDVKASNFLLWTLDPDSLCHCKLCDFGVSTHLSPVGVRGPAGTRGFIAPEVMHIVRRNQYSTYDHRADIFSFGMLLYQMIARRHPYHNLPPSIIEEAIQSGERPKLQDVDISHTGYHYLTQIMKACWEHNPYNRLDTDTIIKKTCLLTTQMVMSVKPIKSRFSLRRAIAITPCNFAKSGYPDQFQSELWVYCDGEEGTEVSMFNIHIMVDINRIFIKDKHVQCMTLYGDQVWLGTRSGIDIISIGSREVAHSIHVHKSQCITCITATDKAVYMGTLEGYCLSYSDINEVQANIKPRCMYISECAIDGIVCTQQYVWIAHTNCICLLNFDDLSVECCIHHETGYIGQLSLDPDHNIIWSAHLGGVILSAWDAHYRCHMFDVDTGRHLERISDAIDDADNNMTAMTPALDTVWVGMATGHIMVFHEEDLLAWFHPYEGYVRFLTCIPSAGPCGLEKAMVVSGGKQFRPLVKGLNESDISSSNSENGTLVIWEAYEAKTMKQMTLIEQNSPDYLNNHNTVRQMIQQCGFKDGTHIMHNLSTDIADRKTSLPGQSFEDSVNVQDLSESPIGSFTESLISSNFFTDLPSLQARVRTSCEEEEIFNIKLPDSEQSILFRCSKPVRLKVLNSEVEVTLARDECPLMYYKDGKIYKLQDQEDLDAYLRLPKKPQLCVKNADSEIIPKIYHATDKSSEEEVNVKIVDPIEQNLKLTCSKPAQLDSLLNEIISLGNLRSQKFNVMYLADNSEIEVNTQEDFDDYLAISNRPPLLVILEQNMSSSNFNEDFELNCTATSTIAASKISSETTEDVTLHFKIFDSEHNILDMTCTKPLRLEAVLNDLKLIANLGDREWQLVYSVDESYVKIETQEDFEKYLSSASMPTLWITNDDI